jgi:hypothetical protein
MFGQQWWMFASFAMCQYPGKFRLWSMSMWIHGERADLSRQSMCRNRLSTWWYMSRISDILWTQRDLSLHAWICRTQLSADLSSHHQRPHIIQLVRPIVRFLIVLVVVPHLHFASRRIWCGGSRIFDWETRDGCLVVDGPSSQLLSRSRLSILGSNLEPRSRSFESTR